MILKTYFKTFLLLSLLMLELPSCSVIPFFNSTSLNQSNESPLSNMSQIEALKRNEYNVLKTTTGSAATSRFYLLFFPIGKHKTNTELYENAYYNAVDNLSNADALIMARQQIKRFTIPLIVVNYYRREVTVTGLGISVKDKVLEN